MSNNLMVKDVLLIGAGNMAAEYAKVLDALNVSFICVGRGEASAKVFTEKTGHSVITGGLGQNLSGIAKLPEYAIITVNETELSHTALLLLESGVKYILLEKPGGLNRKEIENVAISAAEKSADIKIAYNRRFYASTLAAEKIIEADGGITSFNFEFTEWPHVIEKLNTSDTVLNEWFLSNSSHVADLAFFMGGRPTSITSYVSGTTSWYKRAAVFSGAGVSEKGALFSYQANWGAPGRWGVELLTSAHRLYFRPMEQLHIQKTGSVAVDKVDIDDRLDIDFKPGLFLQTQAFLHHDCKDRFLTVQDQLNNMEHYERMQGI